MLLDVELEPAVVMGQAVGVVVGTGAPAASRVVVDGAVRQAHGLSRPHTLSMKLQDHQRCTAQNKRGERCGARAVDGKLCVVHSGRVDPIAIGRKGGLAEPQTELRRAVREDEKIRESAKDVLRRGLAGDESVSKTMLDAARSVFSFRAAQPPSEPPAARETAMTPWGRPVTTLADVLAFGLEIAPAEMEATIARARALARPPVPPTSPTYDQSRLNEDAAPDFT